MRCEDLSPYSDSNGHQLRHPPFTGQNPIQSCIYVFDLMSKANVFECRLSLKPAQQGGQECSLRCAASCAPPPFCQEEEDKAKIQKELSILTDRHLTRHRPGGSQLDIKQTLGDGRPVGDNPKSKITPERFKVNISISKPPSGKIFCIFCGLLDCWAYQPSQLHSYTLLRPPEGE